MTKNIKVSQSYLKAKRVVQNEANRFKHLKSIERYVQHFCDNAIVPENEKMTIFTLFKEQKEKFNQPTMI